MNGQSVLFYHNRFGSAWLLLSFSPFPVRHPGDDHGSCSPVNSRTRAPHNHISDTKCRPSDCGHRVMGIRSVVPDMCTGYSLEISQAFKAPILSCTGFEFPSAAPWPSTVCITAIFGKKGRKSLNHVKALKPYPVALMMLPKIIGCRWYSSVFATDGDQ